MGREDINTSSSSTNSDYCSSISTEDGKLVELFSFWFEGVALVLVALLGIAVNTIAIYILNKPDLRTFFSHLLMVLIFFDSMYLLLSIIEAFRRSFYLTSDIHIYLFPYILFPFHSLFLTASIFMTVAMAIERYRAIHYPMKQLHLTLIGAHGTQKRYQRRLFKYVLLVVISSVIITVPRFFELTVIINEEESNNLFSNETIEESRPFIRATALRKDPLYNMYYINFTRFLFTGAGPIVLLIFFYSRIYQTVRVHNMTMQLIIMSTTWQNERILRHKQENELARLFSHLILVFITCHAPRVLINVREMMVIDKTEECYRNDMSPYGVWLHLAICLSHFLLVINASVNILFYICQNAIFMKHFLAVFRNVVSGLRCARDNETTQGNNEQHSLPIQSDFPNARSNELMRLSERLPKEDITAV